MRRLLGLTVTLVVAGCVAGAAFAGPADDARAAADRFMTAVVKGDAQTACDLLAQSLLEKYGGAQRCVESFADSGEDGQESVPSGIGDYEVFQELDTVFRDARALAVARGGYVTKHSSLARLVRNLRQLEPDLKFSLGRGPKAARDKPPYLIVVDRHTSKGKLMLYAESDSGTIWRLTGGTTRRRVITKAGDGVSAGPQVPSTPSSPPPPPTYTIGSAVLADDGTAYVNVAYTYDGGTYGYVLAMRQEAGQWKVADILLSFLGSDNA